jgi:hypothetical protein
MWRSRSRRAQLGRRGFLGALVAPVALSVAGRARAAPPDPGPGADSASPGGGDSTPDRRDPDIEVVRALSFPIGLEPAVIFRASPDDEP